MPTWNRHFFRTNPRHRCFFLIVKLVQDSYLGVEPKIGVVNPPKWMVKIMENPIKIDDLGGKKRFLETPICCKVWKFGLFPHHISYFFQKLN